jgi:type VI secretion system protein
MPITLKIISYQRLAPEQQATFQSDLDRFSIGRNPDNHWALPDPQRFMSGVHCWLENRNGSWFITDTSTNGVFINGSDERVPKNDSVELDHGDRLRLGDYELKIDLRAAEEQPDSSAAVTSARPINPFEEVDGGASARGQAASSAASGNMKQPNTPLSQMDKNMLGDAVSIDELYALDEDEEEETPPSLASQGEQASPLQHHFSVPEVSQPSADPGPYASEQNAVGDDWDVETGYVESPLARETEEAPPAKQEAPAAQPPAPAPDLEPAAPVPPRPAAGAVPATSALGAFATGAGLQSAQLGVANEAEFFHNLGALLRTVTEGLIQTLASRRDIKSEFRLEQTMIAPTKNNPFKFSVSADEALVQLLTGSDQAFLTGKDAAADAIDDINAHQMAVLAGTEAALKSILKRFMPGNMEEKFGSGSLLSKAMPALKKARYWEFYKVLYDEVSEAADDDFQQFFGSEFSSAYEKQLDRLKISRKDSST